MRKITVEALCVNFSKTIEDALHSINEVGIGACVIINSDKFFVGILTDGDIRRAMESREKEFFGLFAKDLMSLHPKLIHENEKLITASSIMSENKINSLLVVNATNNFVGVVQMYDLGI